MTLENALAKFRNLIEHVTGDYTTFDRASGFWSRRLPPGAETTTRPQSRELIRVVHGDILIRWDGGVRHLNAGGICALSRGKTYSITGGDYGAEIQYKYF